jgi:hypothetical protein
MGLATRYRLATMFADGHAVRGGGLMSYGPGAGRDLSVRGDPRGRDPQGKETRRAANRAAHAVRAAVNVTTARALGLALRQAVLPRADGIIQQAPAAPWRASLGSRTRRPGLEDHGRHAFRSLAIGAPF